MKEKAIAIHDDLTDAFIEYQYRLENPMLEPDYTHLTPELKYHQDPIFNRRVKSLVAGVMVIIQKHVDLSKP